MGPAKGKEATMMKNPDKILRLLCWWPDSPFWNPNFGFPDRSRVCFWNISGENSAVLWVGSSGKPEKGGSFACPTTELRSGSVRSSQMLEPCE